MFTVCPKCALTLVVTPADLRVAQGYVRCGRCLNVFNALVRLAEERPTDAGTAAGAGLEPPPAPQSVRESATPSPGPIELVPDTAMLARGAPGSTVTEDSSPISAHSQPPGERIAPTASVELPPPPAEPAAPGLEILAPRTPAARFALGRGLAAAALALALSLQVVNHYRGQLATNPRLLEPMTKAYAALGIRLIPLWNVRAYDVRQLGAAMTATKPARVTVRASIKNTAREPLPMPLLRVVLQDRFGNNIAARNVPPRAYLPPSVAPGAFIPAGGRIDATVALVDPGPVAAGFEIDACLLRPGGGVACAHSP